MGVLFRNVPFPRGPLCENDCARRGPRLNRATNVVVRSSADVHAKRPNKDERAHLSLRCPFYSV